MKINIQNNYFSKPNPTLIGRLIFNLSQITINDICHKKGITVKYD